MDNTEIKAIREAARLTQAEFGSLFGKGWRAVASWEAGKRRPPKADVHALKVLQTYLRL